jgi:SOS-response transcriptional repressor LexA
MEYFCELKKKDKDQITSLFEIEPDTISLLKVIGTSYISYFIYDGDVLMIDTNLNPIDGDKVLVRISDKECIKIYRIIGEFGYLQTDISTIFPEKIGDLRYEILGVIIRVLHISNEGFMN